MPDLVFYHCKDISIFSVLSLVSTTSIIKYVPDSYHVGIRLQESKILPSLAIYFDGFLFTPSGVYKISTWVSCWFYFNFHFVHIIWTTDTKGKFIKTVVPKMRSDRVYLSLHFY